MKNIFLIFILAFSLFFFSCNNTSKENKVEKAAEKVEAKTVYQCPMDCENGKTYDKCGQCPECGMDMEKVGTNPKQTDDSTHQN